MYQGAHFGRFTCICKNRADSVRFPGLIFYLSTCWYFFLTTEVSPYWISKWPPKFPILVHISGYTDNQRIIPTSLPRFFSSPIRCYHSIFLLPAAILNSKVATSIVTFWAITPIEYRCSQPMPISRFLRLIN